MYSIQRNPKYFHDPAIFSPERWIDPECKDNLAASQPFSIGSRACVGKQ